MLLFKKESKLSAILITYIFIIFGIMVLIPRYPIVLAAFFICYGVFHSFQACRENNDIVYSALLPVSKKDIVKAKYMFSMFIELLGFIVMLILTIIRMSILKDSALYADNTMLNANFVFLGICLLSYGCFNAIFIGGFFKTAYYFGKPFLVYGIVMTFIVIGVEVIHHIPGFEVLNSAGFENIPVQMTVFFAGLGLFFLMSFVSMHNSVKRFEKIDI